LKISQKYSYYQNFASAGIVFVFDDAEEIEEKQESIDIYVKKDNVFNFT